MGGRLLSLLLFMPFLANIGYGLMWSQLFVLTWGSLRGAIGITFALIVAKDEKLKNE